MKILISAYACDPYRGSEPGVGWTAVCRIAKKHDIWVLADDHNREGWERRAKEGNIPSNVQVRFLRKNKVFLENRFLAHIQSWLRYAAFNRLVLKAAQDWHAEVGFDLCHQVTIAAWRMPSPLWRLPIPFVWGPIGGAGYIPPKFRGMLSVSARAFERVRDFNTALMLRSKAFRNCIKHTAVVFAANEETELLLKPHRQQGPLVRLPIASIPKEKAEQFLRPAGNETHGPLRLFAGGNLEGRKAVSLALRALAKVKAAGVSFHYTLAGGGPEVPSLRKLCAALGLDDCVEFHPGYRGEDYIAALQRSHVYFLPSFRESTPVTLLEAYLAGCYPVVADTSAQGEIVRLAGGTAVPVNDMESLIQGLADAVIHCDQNRNQLPTIVENARQKLLQHFDSTRYDEVIATAYETALSKNA
jgi:glycosyltransferase involved in cell wall biosynthesis